MNPTSTVDRLLAERIGLDPSAVGEGLITRGVLARMMALSLRDRKDYERVLLGSATELQALIEEVVVPESWFFRDARPFETFREHARSGWIGDGARPPLSVLSIPCAGGEEPYSIAMTLLELGLPAERFRVDAVDISARSVARAISGVYTSNSFRGVDGSIRSRYFREQGGVATLDLRVRSSVRFHLGNLLDPELFADRPGFDVVFCRNLLIYFDGPSRGLAFARLGRLMVDDGLLFLGHADRGDDTPGSTFTPLADKGSFAYRKGPAVPRKTPPVDRPKPASASTAPRPTSVNRVAPIVVLPGRDRKPEKTPRRSDGPALEEASSLADEGRYDEALKRVDRVIAESGASARAYFLLGMIHQAAGDRGQAETFLLKAVYLDGQDDEALLALALLAHRRGDVAAESAYRRRAERVRLRKGAS